MSTRLPADHGPAWRVTGPAVNAWGRAGQCAQGCRSRWGQSSGKSGGTGKVGHPSGVHSMVPTGEPQAEGLGDTPLP